VIRLEVSTGTEDIIEMEIEMKMKMKMNDMKQ
jgi:hypothetical protein